MRRISLLLLTCCTVLLANAQFTTLWEKTADASYAWFTSSSGNTTGCAYNPVTNKLLLADRNNLIAIINVATGASEGTLLTTGVGTESYKWNKIRVTADGVIYGISLVTAAGTCKVYRWDNQTAVPTLCASFAVTERCGDAFGLSGTGTNTVLYASGNGITASSVNIYVLTTADGLGFTLNKTINIPITGTSPWAGRSIDPVTTGTTSDLWIRSQNTNTRRISSTGAVLYTSVDGAGTDQVVTNFSNARYFTSTTGKKFMAYVGTSSAATGGLQLRVLNITNEAAVTNVGTATLSNTALNSNPSGIGEVAIKDNGDNTFTFFYVIPNNGVMAVLTDKSLPVNISAFSVDYANGVARLNWATANETNNKGFYIERSINGTDFSAIDFVEAKLTNNAVNTYTVTDTKVLAGKSYYRLKQMDRDGQYIYSKIVSINNTVGKKDFSVRLLSNPVQDKIQLNIQSNTSKQVWVTVTNADGKVLIKQQHTIATGENNIAINIAALPKGALFVKVHHVDGANDEPAIHILKQ